MGNVMVLGARNLGSAILHRFLADGWQGAAVARSEETLTAVRELGALAMQADVRDSQALRQVLAHARDELGGLDVVVNATSVATPAPGERYGGGLVADASVDAWRRWGATVGEMAFVFLSEGARALRDTGRGGALVQVGNGLARRPRPGEGLWAAGQQASRALVHAAAEELRAEDIRVSLVIVDALIDSPKLAALGERVASAGRDADRVGGPRAALPPPVPPGALADMGAIAETVAFAATRGSRGSVVELVVSTSGQPWIA